MTDLGLDLRQMSYKALRLCLERAAGSIDVSRSIECITRGLKDQDHEISIESLVLLRKILECVYFDFD